MNEVIIPIQEWARCIAKHAPEALPLSPEAYIAILHIQQHPSLYPPTTVTVATHTVTRAHAIVVIKLQSIGIFAEAVNVHADWTDPLVEALKTKGLQRIGEFTPTTH